MIVQCVVCYAEMWSGVRVLIQSKWIEINCQCLNSSLFWFIIQYNDIIHSQSGLVVECSLSVLYARLQSNLNKRDVAPR